MTDGTTLLCSFSARFLQIRQYHTTSAPVLILLLWLVTFWFKKMDYCTQGQFVDLHCSWCGWSWVNLKTSVGVAGNTYLYSVMYDRELMYFVVIYEYYYVRHTVKYSTHVRRSPFNVCFILFFNLSWYYCYRQIVQDAIDMADQRLVSPVIAKKFLLEKVNEAVQFVLDKKSTGKVIIAMKNDD